MSQLHQYGFISGYMVAPTTTCYQYMNQNTFYEWSTHYIFQATYAPTIGPQHKLTSSPCSLATEAERIPRSRFKNVTADSHSEIILVTEEGSLVTESDDPRARAACESLRFLKFPRNCNEYKQKKRKIRHYKFMAMPCKCAASFCTIHNNVRI